MGEAITAGLNLAISVLKKLDTEAARKHLDRAVQLQLEIVAEESKPYDQQNDAKIVELKKQSIIIMGAASAQLALKGNL